MRTCVVLSIFLFFGSISEGNTPAPAKPQSVCEAMYLNGPLACFTADDATPLAGRIPNVLVPGLNLDSSGSPLPEMWDNFVAYGTTVPWVAEKFKTYRVTYYSNLIRVSNIGRILAELVDDMDALDPSFAQQKIFVNGHSMGGLVARSFMQEWRLQGGRGLAGGERVLRLVTLATPHHGTPLANGPSRDASAGPLLGSVINLFDYLFFNGYSWSSYNRYDLHADSYLNSIANLDYSRFPQDANVWLDHLNAQNPYEQKISTYGGSIHTRDNWSGGCDVLDNVDSPTLSDVLDCSALLINGLYNVWLNDGIVPYNSTFFPDCVFGCNNEVFFGYNHNQMVQGLALDDSYLFNAILSDMSEYASVGDNRFGALVTMGDLTSEAFHNLRGWAETGQDSAKAVFRNQPTEQLAYVDLFVPRAGVPYTLSFKRGGNTCGDVNFYAYVTIDGTDVPTDLLYPDVLHCQVVGGDSVYQFQVPSYAIKKNKVRLGFLGWQPAPASRLTAPMYYVRLDPA